MLDIFIEIITDVILDHFIETCVLVGGIIFWVKIQKIEETLNSIKASVSSKTPQEKAELKKEEQKTPPEILLKPTLPDEKPATSIASKIHSPELKKSEDAKKEGVKTPLKKIEEKPKTQVDIILTKIWNWILIGQEEKPNDVSFEYAIASTWLLRVGIIALVSCVGYFLKWSIDNSLIGEWGRVSLSILSGILMLGIGMRVIDKKYKLIGQGLLGGGLATLYFSMYAAGPLYSLLNTSVVFAMMCLITVTGGVLSVRLNSILIAIFGIIGGFGTPIMLAAPNPDFLSLFSYLIVLNSGVLGISYWRNWRLLSYLAMYFTYVFVIGACISDYSEELFTTFFIPATLLFIIYASLTYLYNIKRQKTSTMLEVSQLGVNTILYTGIGYFLIETTFGMPYPAALAIGLGCFFLAHIMLFLRSTMIDKKLLVSFITLTAVYLAWAVPLLFDKNTITITWSLQALALLWIGCRIKSNFMRQLGYTLYAIVMVRLLFVDIHTSFQGVESLISFGVYLKQLGAHLIEFGIPIASLFGGFYALRKEPLDEGLIHRKNDTEPLVKRDEGASIFFWISVVGIFLFLLGESTRFCRGFLPEMALSLQTLLLSLGAISFVSIWKSKKKDSFLIASSVLAGIVIAKLFFVDFIGMYFVDLKLYLTPLMTPLGIVSRGVSFLVVTLVCWVGYKVVTEHKNEISKRTERVPMDAILGVTGLAVFFLYLTAELNVLLHVFLPAFQAGGVSVLWLVFAIGLLVTGITKEQFKIRVWGLSWLVIVILKVFIVDLAGMDMIVRVISFFIVGLGLVGSSMYYIKSNEKFNKN